MDWNDQQLDQLKKIFLTQTPIETDWSWKIVTEDLKSLSDLLGVRVQASEEPNGLVLRSDLLSYQPNRSLEAQSQLPSLERLLKQQAHPNRLSSSTVGATEESRERAWGDKSYDQSIFIATRFLIGRHLDHQGISTASSISRYLYLLENSIGLANSLFRLILEFSKVCQARRMVNQVCLRDLALNRLERWHRSIQLKKLDFFDDEPDRLAAAKELLDREFARETLDQ